MKRQAPATLRNREPILEVLRRVLPDLGLVLEIASGSGEHVVHFASALQSLTWQPSDPDAESRASIVAWAQDAALPNLLPPLALDAASNVWPIARASAILCINMVHIAPFSACEGLMRGAGKLLATNAPLVTYGPYTVDGRHIAPSNQEFDESLRIRNPDWGVRDIAEVASAAAEHGLELAERVVMPANNFTLVWRKR